MELTEERRSELKVTISQMRAASGQFYGAAAMAGNHAFIEFTGLMNEYITVCEAALAKGIDFTQCSVHTGERLPFEPYHFNYIQEKLDCIYGVDVLRGEVA